MGLQIKVVAEYDRQSREFWSKTRCVIHGKADSARFRDQAWGFGIVPETDKRVYLWDTREGAEDHLSDREADSPDKTIPKEFEIREVKERDLRTTYLRAHIIGC